MEDKEYKTENLPEPEREAQSPETIPTEAEPENKPLFGLTPKYKFILIGSLVSILLETVLIYAGYRGAMEFGVWQICLWCVGLFLALYAVFSRRLAPFLLNVVLVFGVSFIPAYQTLYNIFKPVLRLFFDLPE